MTKEKKIEFFIDTYSKEAYELVMNTIYVCNSDDVDEKFNVRLLQKVEETENCTYLHLAGTWAAYRCFVHPPGVNTKDPKNFYSLTHYEE
jgi:hypothetical protein